MSHHLPLFQFRLRNGMSIGPRALNRIWSSATGLHDGKVSRELRRMSNQQSEYVYALSGPANLHDLPTVEIRLRRLLHENLPTAHVELMRLL